MRGSGSGIEPGGVATNLFERFGHDLVGGIRVHQHAVRQCVETPRMALVELLRGVGIPSSDSLDEFLVRL